VGSVTVDVVVMQWLQLARDYVEINLTNNECSVSHNSRTSWRCAFLYRELDIPMKM